MNEHHSMFKRDPLPRFSVDDRVVVRELDARGRALPALAWTGTIESADHPWYRIQPDDGSQAIERHAQRLGSSDTGSAQLHTST